MRWILKAIIQKSISFLPNSHDVNFLFQRYVTRNVQLTDEYFYDRLGHAQTHLQAYQQSTTKHAPDSTLEIGTGWYPVVPIAMFLAGARQIRSVDITSLLTVERLATTLQAFIRCHDTGRLSAFVTVQPERLQVLQHAAANVMSKSLQETLSQLYITSMVQDARNLPLQDSSVDLVHSNNTFEHIYPDILKQILSEFKRIVRKDNGVMSHGIDMSDHFAHMDTSITIYNFLRFTERQWSIIDNDIQPQNRLRMDDYRDMYRTLEIPITNASFRPGDVAAVRSIRLAPPFNGRSPELLAISHCHLTSHFVQQ